MENIVQNNILDWLKTIKSMDSYGVIRFRFVYRATLVIYLTHKRFDLSSHLLVNRIGRVG